MSAPAMNARSPAPVSTATPHSSSSARPRKAASSSSSSSVESAFSTSGRLTVTTATRPCMLTSIDISRSPRAPAGTRRWPSSSVPGVNTAATPCSRSASASGARDRAADDHEHVVGALVAQQLEDARHERHVRAREDRDADRVGVLLHDGLDDLLRRLVQARVDDLHAGIAKRPGDDLGSAIVAIESRLRNDHADPACHPPDCMSRRPPSGPGEARIHPLRFDSGDRPYRPVRDHRRAP